MFRHLLLVLLMAWHAQSMAGLTIEITQGAEGAIPIAIVPLQWQGQGQGPSEDLAAIIAADLTRSGRFKTLSVADMLSQPGNSAEVDYRDWRALGQDAMVVGSVEPNGPGGYMVRFQLLDVLRGEQLSAYKQPSTEANLRLTAHYIADIIFEQLTGIPGAFATRIAYVTEDGNGQVSIEVADSDGHKPAAIVRSREPLMSPAWSPDGKRLAYVSFENRRQAIYVQNLLTGERQRVAAYKGINSSPAWSPDGRRLAMTLSKDGNPDIYVLDLASKRLRRLTDHYAIDTEAAWSPDGQHIVFTSDRGGGPQIYRMPSGGGQAKRLTFQNSYNGRASYAPDGKSLTLVTRENGQFRIAILDLASNLMQVLTRGSLDESPSFAPNGSMILYATKNARRGELSAVSSDGRVRQRIALDAGDVREPDWSPMQTR